VAGLTDCTDFGACLRRFTLYTDGIVEARNATRELFGFERVQRLAQERKSAEQIVEAACAFGQEDDITVCRSGEWRPPKNQRRRG